jgi:hypothetical protein
MNEGFKKFIAASERDRLDIFLAASRRQVTRNPPTTRHLDDFVPALSGR